MLNREQQQLLAALGAGMAVDALLDRLGERGTLEGGRSAPQDGCWITYNRKAVCLENDFEFAAGLHAAGDATSTDTTQKRNRARPKVVLKVTWTEAASHGESLPQELCAELATLRRAARDLNCRWSEFGDAHGGPPWRRRFTTNEESWAARTEWDTAYGKHLVALGEVRDHQKVAIARALPRTVDDAPADLLELLDQQTPPLATSTPSAALKAGALRVATTSPSTPAAPEEGLFTLPSTDPDISR